MECLWSSIHVCSFPVYPQEIGNTPGSLGLSHSFFSEDFKTLLRMVFASVVVFTST